jgi:hypothetical protein
MKPTAAQIKSAIQTQDSVVWSEASGRPDALDAFEGDLSEALAAAWSDVVDGFVIASVPVTGGGSPPGGPLAGGVATLSPGSLTNSASFTAAANKFSTSFPDGATEGLLALVDAVSQGIGSGFALWLPGYSATLVAVGGTCGWSPPPTPAPGPWAGGSIQPQPLAAGASAGDAAMTAASLEAAIGLAADPSKLKQNQGALQPALSALVGAIAKGFETTWTQWKAGTTISGGTGTGTASPPAGTVIGAVSSPTVS